MKKNFGKYSDVELYSIMKNSREDAEPAFAEIYARYSQRIFAYCLRMTGDHAEAQDIFQEVFIKFYQSVSDKEILVNIPAYLLKTARNLCLNRKRDKKINLKIEEFNLPVNDNGYDQRELLQILASALNLLDFESREAFVLRQYQGFSYEEISQIVGDTVTAVKTRVWRAKERLKEILQPYLIDYLN